MIEDPPSGDTDDQVPDALVNVVLSFNQHFTGQWMVSPPAGVVVFTRSNLLPVCVEHITQEICLLVRLFSRMHTTAGSRSALGASSDDESGHCTVRMDLRILSINYTVDHYVHTVLTTVILYTVHHYVHTVLSSYTLYIIMYIQYCHPIHCRSLCTYCTVILYTVDH